MSFFRHEIVDAAAIKSFRNQVTRVHSGDLDGVIVEKVYERAACEAICAELEANRHGLVRTTFPAKFRAYFYGVNLNLAAPDLGPYFVEAARFQEGLKRVFPGPLDLERRVSGLLGALDRGRRYLAPPGAAPGQRYMFTTLRAHLTDGYIPAHFDDEQAQRPSYRQLMRLIEPKLVSFVLAFSQAEQGGALEVFNIREARYGQRIVADGRSAHRGDLEGAERFTLRLGAGDMIVFRSGEYLHRLTPVVGPRTRWTACSFMANARDGAQVYCWG